MKVGNKSVTKRAFNRHLWAFLCRYSEKFDAKVTNHFETAKFEVHFLLLSCRFFQKLRHFRQSA